MIIERIATELQRRCSGAITCTSLLASSSNLACVGRGFGRKFHTDFERRAYQDAHCEDGVQHAPQYCAGLKVYRRTPPSTPQSRSICQCARGTCCNQIDGRCSMISSGNEMPKRCSSLSWTSMACRESPPSDSTLSSGLAPHRLQPIDGASLPHRCGSARLPDCRSCFCPATTKATVL